MTHNKQENKTPRQYWVVLDEQQELVVWPAHRELPIGWQRTEMHGTRAECLAYIKLGSMARDAHKPAYAHEMSH